MEKKKPALFAITWIITLVISIGGGFIGAKIYNVYFNKPPKFYQFDLVKAIKNKINKGKRYLRHLEINLSIFPIFKPDSFICR